jgi:outer membrane lipoprotein-sorting protein
MGVLLLLAPMCARADPPSSEADVEAIVQKLDELYRSTSSHARLEMHVVTPHWERTLRMEAWSRGMEKTLIRITSPAKEKGVATLRVGNEMWNYLPKTNKVMKVPPSMMMSSWMGSDFTNDDLVREFTFLEDYMYERIYPPEGQEDLIYLRFTPKEGRPIVWGKVVGAVRKADYLPVWEEYYDEKDRLMRQMNFKEIEEFDGRRIPSVLELLPQNKEGHRTVVRYLEVTFNLPIPEDRFSLRALRSQR